jgi:signal transduction histidine kinase
MGINTYVKGKSKKTLMIVAILFTTLIGYIDYITGFKLRIDIFYLLPISFAAWYISKRVGILISLMSVLAIFFSDILSDPDHHFHVIDLWNISMVFLFFIVVTLSLSKLEITLYKQRQLSSELQKTLEAFSYSVSHDLRGPLWRIDGYTEMIAEKYSDKLDEGDKDYLHRIASNTQKMKDIIDALLKLSIYSRGNPSRSKVELTAMVKQTLEESAKSWPGRTVEIVIADGVTADGDPALLQVIVSNLIGNAWKFTKH